MPNAHPVVMFEFIARDQQSLSAFYRSVFGWQFDLDDGFGYVRFQPRLLSTLGGIGQAQPDTPGWEPGRNFYLATDDLSATLERVITAGGSVYVPTTSAGGYRFAMFTDPEGNVVGLLEQPDHPDS